MGVVGAINDLVSSGNLSGRWRTGDAGRPEVVSETAKFCDECGTKLM